MSGRDQSSMRSRSRVELGSGSRVLLAVVGGMFAIGVVESAATVYSLLRFGLGGTQSAIALLWASAIAGIMLMASFVAALAVLGSAVGRNAWSIQRGLYGPLLLIAIAAYVGLLLCSILISSSSLAGELLIEKRFSIGVYALLAVAAVVVGALRSTDLHSAHRHRR